MIVERKELVVAETALPVVQVFPTELSSLGDVRRFVRRKASEIDLSPADTERLTLAITEACSNVVFHTTSRVMYVSWWVLENEVEIRVKDEGVFGHIVTVPEAEDHAGVGIPLMLAIVDGLTIHKGTSGQPGTVVRFTIQASASERLAAPVPLA